MLNALVDGVRSSPVRGLKGTCPACESDVIAKCGPIRIPHWAHKSRDACEFSWEPETEWHRAWKMLFPAECQEFIQRDQRGERHIADVCLPHGQVIEFQHSHLCPQERIARESFHKNMWWVVDGARLSRDFPRFAAAFPSFRPLWQGVYVTPFPEEAFPLSWLNSDVPVFFDFESAVGVPQDKLFVTRALWCLLPRRPLGQAVVFALSKETFTRMAQDEAQSKLPEAIRSKAEEILDLERQVRVARLRAAQMSMRQQQALRYRRRPPRF